MIDEAFMPFQEIIEKILSFGEELSDEEAGVRSYITRYEIDTPVELNVVRDEDGALHIGTTPPLYYVKTSVLPSFHRLRFTAQINEDSNGD